MHNSLITLTSPSIPIIAIKLHLFFLILKIVLKSPRQIFGGIANIDTIVFAYPFTNVYKR